MRPHKPTVRSRNQSPIQGQSSNQGVKANFSRRVVPIVAAVSLLMSPGIALGQARDHGGHKSPLGHPACAECGIFSKHDRTQRPFEAGQGVFAAMQEMVMLLEGKPDTDWSKFSLERLYTHLVDMNEITLNTRIETRDLDDGLEMTLSGAPRTLEALLRVIPEQAVTLGRINAWESAVRVEPGRVVLTLTSKIEEEVRHIKGLGFIGLMASGSGHHQPFHLALARGETDGAWPRAEYLTKTEAPAQPSMRMGGQMGGQMVGQMAEQAGAGQGMDHMSQMEGGQGTANGRQPYAGLQTRQIKALSEQERDGLLSGKGIGYALAAELNHYPGPRHILDMTEALELSPAQIANTQGVFERMEAEAISLGKSIVDKEAALDTAFATEEIDRNKLETLVSDIARLEGKLRTVHLSTHLEMKRILTPRQVALYDRMRGYVQTPEPGMVHKREHQN